MGFSSEWETVYKENKQLSVWPWSHLVSLAHRYGNLHEGMRVLEIGCGAGANIPFFISVGADYYGVEGSGTMAKRLNEKFGGGGHLFVLRKEISPKPLYGTASLT
ncbi:MAG: hypothetical protein J6O04_08340 [Selenomonadaceae bacterium]|nr:hypothetical protein [Selenomonadaceae bacterium]